MDRWLTGRKEIGHYLGVSPRVISRLRLEGAPIILERTNVLMAKTLDLDAWRRARDVGRCPRDGTVCPLHERRCNANQQDET